MDFERLPPSLRPIADALIAARPALAVLSAIEEHIGPSLVIRSPTGDRRIVIWDQHGDLGLGFGPWHTHGDIARGELEEVDEVSALVATALAIVDGALVILTDLGGRWDGDERILDLRNQHALLEYLTSRWSPGRARLRSWSGEGDREVSLDELE